MLRQCPNCESMDVQLNEKGQTVCFTCFNIFSSDKIETRSASPKDIPPFPEELERKHLKRKSNRDRNSDSSENSSFKRIIA